MNGLSFTLHVVTKMLKLARCVPQQWAWTGALDRYAAPPAYRPDGRWDGEDPL